jgi:hypothetical protein
MANWRNRATLSKADRGGSCLGVWSLPGAVSLLSLMAALALSLQPDGTGPVALLFPPWWSAMRSVVAAASVGSVVRLGAFPFIVVVQPTRDGPTGRIGRGRAWLALDPQALGGCGLLPHRAD